MRVVIRTCIGCRQRVSAAELLRVAAGPVMTEVPEQAVSIHPDPLHRVPGRGAWLHPGPDCMALAERRRAFGRALRIAGPTDITAVREYIDALDQ